MTNTNKFKEVDELFDKEFTDWDLHADNIGIDGVRNTVKSFLHTQIEKALKEQAESILGETEKLVQSRPMAEEGGWLYDFALQKMKEIIKGYIKWKLEL